MGFKNTLLKIYEPTVQYLREILNLAQIGFTYLVPKKKNSFVFVPLHDHHNISGNIATLFSYLQKNHPEIDVLLVTYRKNKYNEAVAKGFPAKLLKYGFLWNLIRAEYIILDSHTKLFYKGNFKLIQLWHGAGYKNFDLLAEEYVDEGTLKWKKKIYPKYELITATSESDRQKKNASFGVTCSRITGIPRFDVFFNSTDNYKKEFGLDTYRTVITYAPTFRDYATGNAFTDSFWSKLQVFLEQESAVFVIKKHPLEEHLNPPTHFKNIMDLSSANVENLLLATDVLITDYSSIATDFSLTNKPILIYAYDFEEYLERCRSMFYDLKEILPKPIMYEENELLYRLGNLEELSVNLEYRKSYNNFKETFHKYKDGSSSKRVFEEIQKLAKN